MRGHNRATCSRAGANGNRAGVSPSMLKSPLRTFRIQQPSRGQGAFEATFSAPGGNALHEQRWYVVRCGERMVRQVSPRSQMGAFWTYWAIGRAYAEWYKSEYSSHGRHMTIHRAVVIIEPTDTWRCTHPCCAAPFKLGSSSISETSRSPLSRFEALTVRPILRG